LNSRNFNLVKIPIKVKIACFQWYAHYMNHLTKVSQIRFTSREYIYIYCVNSVVSLSSGYGVRKRGNLIILLVCHISVKTSQTRKIDWQVKYNNIRLTKLMSLLLLLYCCSCRASHRQNYQKPPCF